MARYAEGDPRNRLGDDDSDPRRPSRRRPTKTTSPAEPWQPSRRKATAVVERVTNPAPARPASLYDTLAEAFHSQTWFVALRAKKYPPIDVGCRPALTATILRERIEAYKPFDGKPEEQIENVVDYAMKQFFARLPNDERHGMLVKRFVHADWWDTLIEESIDHWRMASVPAEAFEEGRRASEEFYAAWPMKSHTERDPALQEAVQRLLQAVARTDQDQPTYEEPLL